MKTMKKLFALLLAVLMVMGMATTAMADDVTITIKNEDNDHSYQAYQIFTGTLDSTSGIFTNVEWGDGVNKVELIAALKANTAAFGTAFADIDDNNPDAKAVAKILGGWSYNESHVKNFADEVNNCVTGTSIPFTYDDINKKHVATVNALGYYFIKEVVPGTNNLNHTEGFTDYLLAVTNSAEIEPKTSKPTFEVTVDYRENGTYGKGVDVQVDDPIYIRMTSKLPELYADYHQYYLRYELTLPDGIVFPDEAERMSQVYLLHGNGTTTDAAASRYTVTYVGNKVTVDIHDLKKGVMNLNDTLVFKTKAILDDPKVIGKGNASSLGNVINGAMYFSNNMNEKSPTTNPSVDDVSHAKMTDSVSVYTYQIQFQKIDSLNTATVLPGAEFKLYRKITTEGATPDTFMYAICDNNGVITGWTPTESDGTTVNSDANGNFIFKGVDAAAYHLKETKAPAKYNAMEEPVLVTISATITGNNLEKLSCIADGATTNGTPNDGLINNVPIRNTLGSTLPETGGIGTTIFYIVGGVLVLGAGAAFVMKRRNEEA